jgi:anthranilate phosphoribosyltransferase
MKDNKKENNIFAESVVMPSLLYEAIYRINIGHDLSEREAFRVFCEVLNLKDDMDRNILMGILLNGVMAKHPTVDEVVGFIKAALSVDDIDTNNLRKISIGKNRKIIAVAGSGKKGIKTTNISSCAAIVAASLGAYVAKTCSKATSSVSGSSDFIESLGANIDVPFKSMIDILKKTGIGFFKIENRVKKFDSLYGGKFFAPHILSFGFAGVVLPFRPDVLLYGLSHPNVSLSAKVFSRLGYENVMVVSTTDNGIHFLDEVGVFGSTSIVGIKNGITGDVRTIQPANILNLPRYDRNSIRPGSDEKNNIKKSIDALSGKEKGAIEDMICVNASTILYLSGKTKDIDEGFTKSKIAIRSGKAMKTLKAFISVTGGDFKRLNSFL